MPPVGGLPPPGTRPLRWRRAQRYELDYWLRRGETVAADADAPRWQDAGRQISALFDATTSADWRRRVLHVGPAGHGEIHYLGARSPVAIEPLAVSLARRGLLVRGEVRWTAAMGEALPFRDAGFSAALLPNVIDHVADPTRVLAELYRCLTPGAPLLLSVHTTDPRLRPFMQLLGRTQIGYFAGHPWAFSSRLLCDMIDRAGFEIIRQGEESAGQPSKTGLAARLKHAVLRTFSAIARKPAKT